jgi:glycosyltransferase involved in cell wall biosynthesis
LTREAQVKGMRRCKISEILVFVPTYNSEKYLRECLDSVLNQTFQDWECVISDDASTDKSIEIAREYEKKDSRFKVLTHEKNVGAANNWNRAKENNNCFATKILCADDYLMLDALKEQLDILKRNETAIVFSERYIIFPNGKKLHPRLPKYASNISFNEAFKYYINLGRNIFGEPVTALFRTDLFVKSEGFYPKFEYSLDTSGYMAIARGHDVTFDKSIVGAFRVSKTQWSYKLKEKQYSHIFDFIDHLVEVEGIQVTKVEVLIGKIKVMIANLLRVFLYKILRDK